MRRRRSRLWPAKQLHDVTANERLAASNSYLAGSYLNERRAEAIQLLYRQEFAPGQERHLFRHTVDAAKIATIGD